MTRVAVLKGGISAEREISLVSGAAIARGLAAKGFDVIEIDVTRPDFEWPGGVDLAFIALHGTYGEDGQVQSYLKQMGVRFTGADESASRLAFDKILSKQCFEKNGINSAAYEVLRPGQPRALSLPVVVKPPRQGSSIGLSKVQCEEEWAGAIAAAEQFDEEVLVEALITGRELTVGIVGEQVLPVIEIRAPQGNYDYHAKYTRGATEYICPAELEPELTRRCQEIAWRAFCALGARGLGRVDLILTDEGEPFVLELNTIPGFTETSLLPKAARAIGIEFADLCAMIVRDALGQND
ncbi:MAG: D-alanine--D-alanine ligase family protein [Kiritimatiellia bacterium]